MRIDDERLEECRVPADFFRAMVETSGGVRRAADNIGVSVPFMSQLANGLRKCSPRSAQRAAKAFPDVKPEWLLWRKRA